ncbi:MULTISPECIES: Ger(x)C family spore germination protein [unclassified Paenibacillus]|uniref:Ger(x)C family spore germination protein n=1 Tax=unclassified Paenibacillus TaxID=185978 RepID=UPI002407700E|nr:MULTISPECIES: Ger(x)C family spore germination protein [unclassified Paenibacillus]MDF9844369.1 spore germination protein KC [Paenibacillus sp. PastF-2]MDF9850973.1 spore germination protein KC [Paenibacillus sp. PastM-2]MDF9857544.1 spore germination protein KC [Paenibacillus sp. PastF-1]MDH6482815.1 spore germination protein KC [Paenibacillus sp. PastH-2]MDH6510240.1 spore germination protein KC [Paenibacillus sp. PastM-3]
MSRLAVACRYMLLLIILCMTTGCWDRREMDDLALIMGSGIDLTDSGLVEVSYQIALPTGIPSAVKSGGSQKQVVIISAKGNDLQEALGRIQQQMSRYVYFGHREVFLIGENYARHGLNQIQDLFTRFPETRYNSYVLTAYGATAKEILSAPYPLELIPALAISKIQSSRQSFSVKFDQFLEAFSSPGTSPVTAAIRIIRKGTDKESIAIDRAAVYLGNKLSGFTQPDEMELLRWWIGDSYRLGFTIQAEPEDRDYKGTISVKAAESSVHVHTKIIDGHPQAKVKFHAIVKVVSNNTRLNLDNEKNRKNVEQLFSRKLKSRFEGLLTHVQKEMKSDIFGLGEELHIEHPYYWKNIEDSWSEVFPAMKVNIEVEFHIEQLGKTHGRTYLEK